MIFRPVDDLEHHSAFEHFLLEVSGVQLHAGQRATLAKGQRGPKAKAKGK
jgi:hypothetical protein